MLTTAQRIEILKIAVELSTTNPAEEGAGKTPIEKQVVRIFRKLKAEVEHGGTLDDTKIEDVKTAIDAASTLEDLID